MFSPSVSLPSSTMSPTMCVEATVSSSVEWVVWSKYSGMFRREISLPFRYTIRPALEMALISTPESLQAGGRDFL